MHLPVFALLIFGHAACAGHAPRIKLSEAPIAPRGATTDTYFGTVVADPYRSLEDEHDSNTKNWVQAQIKRSEAFLRALPGRQNLRTALDKLEAHSRMSTPTVVGGRTYFGFNDGKQAHDSLYTGDPSRPSSWRLLVDPTQIDPSNRTSLSGMAPGPCGKHLAYAVSVAGSDMQKWRILRLADTTVTADDLAPMKFPEIRWESNEAGFYYSRMVDPSADRAAGRPDGQQQVFYHKLGTHEAQDRCIFAHPDPAYDAVAKLSADGSLLAVLTARGSERQQGVYVSHPHGADPSFQQILPEGQASATWVGIDGNRLLLMTTQDAPRGRLVALDASGQDRTWNTVIAESEDTLYDVHLADSELLVTTIHDTASRVRRFTLDGRPLGTALPLPEVAWSTGLSGARQASELYVNVTSSTLPSTIFKLTRTAEGWHVKPIFQTDVGVDMTPFVTYRAFAHSADGTRVPMILSHRRDLVRDGRAPTRMYGYGGFTLPVYPSFHEDNLLWMQHGGVIARVAARGGGEYGATWHEEGSGLHKQHTFDDFAAAARYLFAEKYTSAQKLGIEGQSNGGLLVATSEVQHPELFAAVHCEVAALDMLRFANFTAGRGWTVEYGDIKNEAAFRALYAYSPLHNIQQGVHYPATLIVTGDHDDRVVPAHSYKFAATLQAAQGGGDPILLQVGRDVGHSGGLAREQRINKDVDKLAFFAWALGLSGI